MPGIDFNLREIAAEAYPMLIQIKRRGAIDVKQRSFLEATFFFKQSRVRSSILSFICNAFLVNVTFGRLTTSGSTPAQDDTIEQGFYRDAAWRIHDLDEANATANRMRWTSKNGEKRFINLGSN